MSLPRTLAASAASLSVLMLAPTASAATRYLSPSGSDAGNWRKKARR